MSKKTELKKFGTPTLVPQRPIPPANSQGLVAMSVPKVDEESDMTITGAVELARESIEKVEQVGDWLDYIIAVYAFEQALKEKK